MNLLYLLFPLFSLLSGGLLFLNSTLYPTFTIRYLGLSSLAIFVIHSLTLLIALFFGYIFLPKKWLRINKNVFFPFLLGFNIILIILEKVNYKNYVLQHLHIFPYTFIYLLAFSGIIFLISFFKSINNTERRIRVLFPILFLVFFYIWIENYAVFWNFIAEDSVIEYLQFMFYLLSALGSFKLFLSFKRKNKLFSLLFLMLSAGLLFISFEEISYGQRIFGFGTPEGLKEINIQNETNIHNLFDYDINQIAYILVGLYGMFSRGIIIRFFPKKIKNLIIFTPPKSLFWYFLFLFLIYFDRNFVNLEFDTVNNNIFRKYTARDWLEISELYLAIAFFYYIKITHAEINEENN